MAKFTDKDGKFESTHKHAEGETSIGYLEELLEWIYEHDNMSKKEKMKFTLSIEDMIEEFLNEGGLSTFKINYVRTWSIKLKKI